METNYEEELNKENILRYINSEEKLCLERIKHLRRQRLVLTGSDLIDFTVSTIHKDKMATIINLIKKVEDDLSFADLEEEWRRSVEAKKKEGWFGTVTCMGDKERLIKVLPKIAKHGGTVTVDPVQMLHIPPPNKWWEPEVEIAEN
ncbi:MAG: hypothetical protein ACOYN6_00275 [Ignavibacteria bacterium]